MRELDTSSRPGAGPWYSVVVSLPLIAGVVLAVVSTLVQSAFRSQRTHTCNGFLPMPTPAFAYAWAGVVCGLLALTLAVTLIRQARRRRRADMVSSRSRVTALLVSVAAIAFLFEVFVLSVAYHEATPIPALCSG